MKKIDNPKIWSPQLQALDKVEIFLQFLYKIQVLRGIIYGKNPKLQAVLDKWK